MFPVEITTDRLRLVRLDADAVDALALYDHVGQSSTVEEETRYVTWSPHDHPEETLTFLTDAEAAWEDGDRAVYAVRVRPSAVEGDGEGGADEADGAAETVDADDTGAGDGAEGPFAGTTALHLEWEKRTATLGIWLRKRFWGRGFSGERARAAMGLAFDVLDLDLVAVTCFPENEQSRRAIEKYVDAAGGQYEGRLRNRVVDAEGAVHDVHRYSVSRAEWREATGGDYDATFRWE